MTWIEFVAEVERQMAVEGIPRDVEIAWIDVSSGSIHTNGEIVVSDDCGLTIG